QRLPRLPWSTETGAGSVWSCGTRSLASSLGSRAPKVDAEEAPTRILPGFQPPVACYRGLSRMAKSPCPDQKSSPKRRTAAIPIASVFDIMVRSWPNKGHDWFGCGCSPEMKQASSNAATHADGESHVEHQNVGQGGVLGPGLRVRSAMASHRRAEGSAGNPDPSVPGID